MHRRQRAAGVVGEFDDSAMMKAFGQSGAGVFFAPTVIASQVSDQYQVIALGQIDTVVEQVYLGSLSQTVVEIVTGSTEPRSPGSAANLI